MKKVLIITYYWPPGSGAGVQRWVKLSKYLSELGVETHVLTVNHDRASYPLRDDSLLQEIGNKVQVHTADTREWFGAYQKISKQGQIPFAGFANEKKPSFFQKLSRFIRGNFFIPDPRKGWNAFAIAAAGRLIRQHGITNVITTSPPHSTQLIGLTLKKSYPIFWISDLRDPWTDIYYYKQFYHLPIAERIDRGYEKKVLETADLLMVVSEDIRRLFQSKTARDLSECMHILPNGYDEQDFLKLKKQEHTGRLHIVYTGTLTSSYPLESLVSVIGELHTQQEIRLSFTGSVSHPALPHLMQLLGSKLSLRGHVSHSEALQNMSGAGVLLLLIPQTTDNKGILTGKLFEYLRSGAPILGIGPADGDAAQILHETGTGRMFNPDDEAGIKRYLLELSLGNIPARNHSAILHYSREMQAKRVEGWLGG